MRWLDLGVIALYLAGITWFGWHFRSSQHNAQGLLPRRTPRSVVGNRAFDRFGRRPPPQYPPPPPLPVIGTPALSFNGNFAFLQLVLGYLLARIVISTLFLPAYFRGEMYTAYELMRVRSDRASASSPPGRF